MGNLVTVLEKLIVKGRSVFRMFDAAETATAGVPDGTLRLYQDGTNSFIQIYSLATGTWDTLSPDAVAAALYAPIGADYLVGSANASLTGEIAVGTTPGGELGGTWASPTVDATHSGSAHVTAHSGLSGIGTNDHHNEAHTVASHSDTSATGSELNTLTDGSNADSLHLHSGGMGTLVHSSDTETGPLTSSSNADALVISGLSIPADHSILIEYNVRSDNPAGASRTVYHGLELNATEVLAPSTNQVGGATNPSTEGAGAVRWRIPPRATNYDAGAVVEFSWVGSDGVSPIQPLLRNGNYSANSPVATITSVTLRYYCASAGGDEADFYLSNIRVWELPD